MGSQTNTIEQKRLFMDTVIAIKVVTSHFPQEVEQSISHAFEAFRSVEQVCSRFHADSEVMRLSRQVGMPVQVSPLLFEAIRFAIAMAEETGGVFDPTVGRKMEAHGFNRHYLSGERLESGIDLSVAVSYRDVEIDEEARTVRLHKPLLLDLGAVAKGLAVDLAVQQLRPFAGFVVDAGGDVFAGEVNEQGEPWRVGVRHPERQEETICTLQVTNAAVCTSGSYERKSSVQAGTHHLIDPQSGRSRDDIVSCTVVAPFAMMADAFSTAAFLLGATQGIALLESNELDGLFVSSALEVKRTTHLGRFLA